MENPNAARLCQEAEISLNAAANEVERDVKTNVDAARAAVIAHELRMCAAKVSRMGMMLQPIGKKTTGG